MSKVLIHNAAVVDPSGERVVLFGGDRLPEWADGQVSSALYRVVEDEPDADVPAERVVDAFGLPEPEDTEEDDEPAGDWYGQV